MNRHHHHSSRVAEIDTRLVAAGVVLAAGGALVAFAGVSIAGIALVGAGRRWMRRMEVHPRERAAVKMRQARQASLAGVRAWQAAADGQARAKGAS